MSDIFVILELQISHVLQYTLDYQFIETSISNIMDKLSTKWTNSNLNRVCLLHPLAFIQISTYKLIVFLWFI